MIRELKGFIAYLWEEFTISVKGVVRPTTIMMVMSLIILIDVIFNDAKHLVILFGLLIFLLLFIEYIRGDWRAYQKEQLYKRIGVPRQKAKDLKKGLKKDE